jgi:hypothetical protein
MLKNSTFCPHGVFVCCVCFSDETPIFFLRFIHCRSEQMRAPIAILVVGTPDSLCREKNRTNVWYINVSLDRKLKRSILVVFINFYSSGQTYYLFSFFKKWKTKRNYAFSLFVQGNLSWSSQNLLKIHCHSQKTRASIAILVVGPSDSLCRNKNIASYWYINVGLDKKLILLLFLLTFIQVVKRTIYLILKKLAN